MSQLCEYFLYTDIGFSYGQGFFLNKSGILTPLVRGQGHLENHQLFTDGDVLLRVIGKEMVGRTVLPLEYHRIKQLKDIGVKYKIDKITVDFVSDLVSNQVLKSVEFCP